MISLIDATVQLTDTYSLLTEYHTTILKDMFNITDTDDVEAVKVGVITSRGVVMTSRGVVMTSSGVVMTSRGVVMTSRGVVMTSRGDPLLILTMWRL